MLQLLTNLYYPGGKREGAKNAYSRSYLSQDASSVFETEIFFPIATILTLRRKSGKKVRYIHEDSMMGSVAELVRLSGSGSRPGQITG